MTQEPGFGSSAVPFEYELLVPSQWGALFGGAREAEPGNKLKIELLKTTFDSMVHLAQHANGVTAIGKATLSRLLNIMAWVDDPDGWMAQRAGCPWAMTFRQACEVLPQIEAEAVADAFRARYRQCRRKGRMAVVAA